MKHLHSGKVRDLYELPGGDLLMVARDTISAYDHVLDTPIPDKGRVLTQLSLWWFERLADVLPNHVVSTEPPPGAPAEWAGRAVVVRRLEMVPVECVARGYLTGSGLAEYRRAGSVCGVGLPPGLVDGSELPEPIFTPTTKAAVGAHDEPMTFAEVEAAVGADLAARLRDITLEVYRRGAALAQERGIIVADTKIELGRAPDGELILADEVLTPDSSRFWPVDGWRPGQSQPSFDKQFVRDWLVSPESGWDRNSGEAPPPLPAEIVGQTRAKYVEAYERITGRRFT
ncbi:phosphoribosylaminoimidazolesuccinocarboxamide synthase [Actinomadura craniellae]|uniref:Phosphoribosylaminoimidazole-succinocarboxamide synthase n=1 Tax=Actinomadura craniellae TaxID=2231787 RepID=A0A365H3I8_9ACTN|nr:phosphoribosylaminoimidazolesuccinocarboxamide synthase [Actinomadura craniellae]RAY13562.1 phosphoribosylaminoimidazolesuccinocarboxamide synthase [Actinomadura craniellae]